MLNRQPADFLEFSNSHMWTIVFTHHKKYKFVLSSLQFGFQFTWQSWKPESAAIVKLMMLTFS